MPAQDPDPEREAHRALVDSYDAECDGDWPLGPDDGYYFQFLLHHLIQAGRDAEARELIHDLDWLLAKWRRAGGRSMLVELDLFPSGVGLEGVRGSVLDFSNAVNRDDLPGCSPPRRPRPAGRSGRAEPACRSASREQER